jgi:NAD-dependent deacetylase
MSDTLIQQAAETLKAASQIAVLTGAGVSKESGVPTFRDAQTGLWAKYNPQELANPVAFLTNPRLVWDWYTMRREMIAAVQPNPGHRALAKLQQSKPSTRIITQNVDDLHEQAGSSAVIHLHGNIAQSKCFANCKGDPTLIDLDTLEWDREFGPPSCPHCGKHVRPNVVWFGEMLPEASIKEAIALSEGCDVMLVVGTSGLVTPAASLPSHAQSHGAKIIEVNPDETPITRFADIKLDGPSGEMLPQVLAAMGGGDA